MPIQLGMNAKLYRNTGTFAVPTWSEIKNVRDLTLNLESGEADVTTRGNNGWRATVATLRDASVEFEMVWDTGDAEFEAIKDAYFNNSSVTLGVFDQDNTVTGAQGLHAVMTVSSFSRNEALEEAITVSVSVKPTFSTDAPEWLVTP